MEETLEILQDNLGQALIDTAYMVVVSAIIGVVLGTLLSVSSSTRFVRCHSSFLWWCSFRLRN